MERYKNLSGQSNVYAYQIGSDNIHVQFNGGSTYVYTYASAGAHHIEQMKMLALAGSGLNGYINTNVRKGYAGKH